MPKSVTINMRCKSEALYKIDRAAAALGVSRSEFIRRASEDRAREIVMEELRNLRSQPSTWKL